MKATVIYSDKVWVNDQLQPATISIANGLIADVSLGHKNSAAKDYSGKVIMPGVIDAHVHINEPGRSDWEGFVSATRAAVKGGTTTVIDMPLNSSPVVINASALQAKIAACKNKLFVNCGFWAGAIDASVADVKELISQGCLGVKVFLSHSGIDEFPNISEADLSLLMEGISALKVPVLAHCEIDTLPADDSVLTAPKSYLAYLRSRPKTWENTAIKKFLLLSQKHNCKTHIVHLASEEILDWLREMKKEAVPFTVETCPHYLLFHAEQIKDGDTLFKCAPPIREKQTAEQLINAIKTGDIDFISSDHSPAPANLKEIESGDFTKAWGGIAGLQFLLSASWTALRKTINLVEFIPLLTSRPAAFLGLGHRIGSITPGYDADLTIWQPDVSFTVLKKDIAHKHKITPYLNLNLFGKIHTTMVNGQIAFQNNKLRSQPYGYRFMNDQKIPHHS